MLKDLLKDPKQLATVGLVTYLAGFLIETIHYGSLGAAPFELVKTRYVLTGILFALFTLAMVYPFWGAIRVMAKADADKAPRRFLIVFPLVWLTSSLTWYFVVQALSAMAQRRSTVVATLESIRTTLPRLKDFVLQFLATVVWVIALAVIVVALTLIVFFVIDGVRKIRGRTLDSKRWLGRRKTLLGVGGLFRYLLFVIALQKLFATSNQVFTTMFPSRGGFLAVADLDSRWTRFLWGPILAALVVFAWQAGYAFLRWDEPATPSPTSGSPPAPQAPSSPPGWGTTLLHILKQEMGTLGAGSAASALVGILLAPYALFVFPDVPQHLGGGAPVVARLTFKQPELLLEGAKDQTVRILERGPNFLVATQETPPRILEFPSASVESIEFLGDLVASDGGQVPIAAPSTGPPADAGAPDGGLLGGDAGSIDP